MLMRHFADGIVRAIYLRNGGFGNANNFIQMLEDVLVNRIAPILDSRMRPKLLIPDESEILSKTKNMVNKKYAIRLKRIYNILVQINTEPYYKTEFLILKNFL